MNYRIVKPQKLSEMVAEQIRSYIGSGMLCPGDRLPSERELATEFGISRPSVREGLNILSAKGLIESFRGRRAVILAGAANANW